MKVVADPRFLAWYRNLPTSWRAAVNGLLRYLAVQGRDVHEPRAKRIESSRHWPDMWELRDDSLQETALRVLFGFHGDDEAVVLVGGNKKGNWLEWYVMAIPSADDRYDQFRRRKEEGQQR